MRHSVWSFFHVKSVSSVFWGSSVAITRGVRWFPVIVASALWSASASAEILVLLPEHGPLASAGASVKEGLMAGYMSSIRRPELRFVDSSDQPMDILLAKEVRPTTELVIGPLERDKVGELVNLTPTVPVLALNEVMQSQHLVWQFALAPDEDATALLKAMRADGVKRLTVLTEPRFTGGERFKEALAQQSKFKMDDSTSIPKSLGADQGLLVFGNSTWVSHLRLPANHVYASAAIFDRQVPLPMGIAFCDTPALFRADWSELNELNKTKPASSTAMRLRAFGADSWQIALLILDHALSARFAGRTGLINMTGERIDRAPVCFHTDKTGVLPH